MKKLFIIILLLFPTTCFSQIYFGVPGVEVLVNPFYGTYYPPRPYYQNNYHAYPYYNSNRNPYYYGHHRPYYNHGGGNYHRPYSGGGNYHNRGNYTNRPTQHGNRGGR